MNKKINSSFWNKIRNLIKLYHLNFLFGVVGSDFLSEEEVKFLNDNLKDKINTKRIPFLNRIFAFGKVCEKIGLTNANKLTQKDLDLWLEQHLEETKGELDKIKAQTYLDVLGKQFKIEKDIRQIILNESQKKDFKISEVYEAVKKKFEDWSYFKDAISYVSEIALNQGKIEEIKGKSDKEDPIVYKVPIQDEKLCIACKKAYLNDDGSPKLFKLSQLEANGTNIGKKMKEWKPTLSMLHSNCRCLLQYFELIEGTSIDDYEWDESKQRYILISKEENLKDNKKKVERQSKVKITIGEKTFEV